MPITLGEAIGKVFSFIIGRKSNDNVVVSDQGRDRVVTNKNIVCRKCETIMRPMNKLRTDFIMMEIYECPNCKTISEYQRNTETKEVVRESHVYDNRIDTRSSIIAETEGYIKYENFTLDKLWVVCGNLCYPALIRSEFTNSTSLIFVKCGSDLGLNSVDGFIINAQNVVGEIRVFNDQNISHFYNPYLARLPHKDFKYISYPTTRCDALEAVDNIRFDHTKEGHNGVYLHKLAVLKDMPLRAVGLEVYVKFYTFGEKFEKPIKMMKLINGINLKDIVMGKSHIIIDEEYSIQSMYVNKHTISSINKIDISTGERAEFYKDIIKFFTTYDNYDSSTTEG